jgi:hypothetical protein
MAARTPAADRMSELLAKRALEGLSAAEHQELQGLIAQFPDVDTDEFDRVAASLVISGLRIEPMPAALRARIEADAPLAQPEA